MMDTEWTTLSEEAFDTEIKAHRFVNVMKMQMQSHYGKYPKTNDNILEFKVSEIDGKFYILYKLL